MFVNNITIIANVDSVCKDLKNIQKSSDVYILWGRVSVAFRCVRNCC